MNDSRTLVLQDRAFLTDEYLRPAAPDSPLRTTAHRQIAGCYCLGQSLRGLAPTAGFAAHVAGLPRRPGMPGRGT